jgi:hypothetical protein
VTIAFSSCAAASASISTLTPARTIGGRGECIDGVCIGQFLIPVPRRVDNGMILIALELPQIPG